MKEKTYKITGRTNPCIAQKSSLFNGTTYITITSGLTLKEAQDQILNYFNEDYGTSFQNWREVRTSRLKYFASTHKDGTRRYEYYSRYFEIELDKQDEV